MLVGPLTFAANAMHRDVRSPSAVLVVIMPNLLVVMKVLRVSIFSSREGSSLLTALYGSAGLSLPTLALLNSLDDIVGLTRRLICLEQI